MENKTRLGVNRTGMQMAPLEGPRQAAYAEEMPPNPTGGLEALAALRAAYAQDADRIGSVPLPATARGFLQTAAGKMIGKGPEVLVDKVGQRLAFERTGTRLYQALITKVESSGSASGGELRQDLYRICAEEAAHFQMLWDAAKTLGADPTAQTPCADTSAVASLGLMQVITDPRTNVAQCLDAILIAELADNAGWELLIEVARATGHDAMATSFEAAMAQEAEHVQTIKRWLSACVVGEAA